MIRQFLVAPRRLRTYSLLVSPTGASGSTGTGTLFTLTVAHNGSGGRCSEHRSCPSAIDARVGLHDHIRRDTHGFGRMPVGPAPEQLFRPTSAAVLDQRLPCRLPQQLAEQIHCFEQVGLAGGVGPDQDREGRQVEGEVLERLVSVDLDAGDHLVTSCRPHCLVCTPPHYPSGSPSRTSSGSHGSHRSAGPSSRHS
jgi:hypothetical protein